MTYITYSDDKQSFSIKSRGHAGYGKHGEDIVCAGISTLMFTFLNVVSDLFPEVKMDDERMTICVRKDPARIVEHAKVFLITGLMSIADEYPHNLVIKKI